jgi:molybdopterin-guanine dinucleotide biosynthesis protein A
LIAYAIDRLSSQVDLLIINANGNQARYADFGLPVVADTLDDYPGPLAGLLAAMRWARDQASDITHIATVPVDTPFFPTDLVARLSLTLASAQGSRLALAITAQDGPQPVFALVDIGLADTLDHDIRTGGARRVGDWLRRHPHVEVAFDMSASFFNVNTAADLAMAAAMLQSADTTRQSIL